MSYCKHYEECGGCSLQHLNKQEYIDQKSAIAQNVVRGLGVEESLIKPLVEIEQGQRRRVDLKVQSIKALLALVFIKNKAIKLLISKNVRLHKTPL